MAQPEGVDVSHHNGLIDWQRVRNAGITFAAIKTTEGATVVDAKAQTNLAGCRNAGIVPAMYHFYRHDVDPTVQATHFLQNIGARAAGDLPPVVDVEEPGDGAGPITYSKTEVVHRIGLFSDAVRTAIGIPPMIYTYPAAWTDVTSNSNAFAASNPLWIASYKTGAPKLVGSWATYTLWQYTDHGSVDGIDGPVDRDRFNGDQADLDGLVTRVLAIGEMAIFKQDGTVRTGPGLSAARIRALAHDTGAVVIDGPAIANGREWWKIDGGAGTVGWSSSKVIGPA
jgi:GH25 family lysozyme M1 (1,4-beta-N-acetylmuramidase)